MKIVSKIAAYIFLLLIGFSSCSSDDKIPEETEPVSDNNGKEVSTGIVLRDGKLYIDGVWKFLKVAKPLVNYSDENAVNSLINKLDIIKEKNYDAIEMNCYWHHFDLDGDGVIDKSLAPLNKLIDAISAKGMYPCLCVETYSVGGGNVPDGFWTKYPEAVAIDNNGEKVSDDEYGFGTAVVSIFHKEYRNITRKYIKNLASGIDTKKILWFETTVEPQYMGSTYICYSDNARQEYEQWRKDNKITDSASEMPTTFPIPSSFIKNSTWNKFRAQFLAQWVNGDAAAYREVAGENALIAVDYLDATESQQISRDGDPVEFLTNLTAADIIQVNWSWYFTDNTPNAKAYERVRKAMKANGKNWAISEHMTFNGSDYTSYNETQLKKILENTLKEGTGLAWEFTNVSNSSSDSFCLYNDDWTPKNVISVVDNNWEYWLERINALQGSN